MDKLSIGALSDRVERLERQNRRLKRLGLSGIACLIVVTIIGGAKLARNADSIGAKAFVLFDDKDRARAVMTVDPDEGPGISFFHADESRRIDVRIDNKGSPRVNLYGKEDKEGAARVELDIKEGTPRMTFTRDDRNKTPQMAALILPGGRTCWYFFDQKGNKRASLSLSPDGSPSLSLQDENGRELFQAPKP